MVSWFIGLFEATLQQVVALAVLMPVVASMGGVSGNQTLALIIRGLALGQISRANFNALLYKELGVGVFNGLLWAMVIGAVAGTWFQSVMLGVVIACAVITNIITAATFGSPMVLRERFDPEVLALGLQLVDDPGQLGGDRVEQAHPDVAEAAVTLLGAEVDDAEHGPVLVPELEERIGQVERRLVAGLALPVAPGHQAHEAFAVERHLLGEHQDGCLDVREVLVEGRGRCARLARDVDDLDRPVRGRAQHLGRAVEQPLAGGPPPTPGNAPVGGPQVALLVRLVRLVRHADTVPGPDGSSGDSLSDRAGGRAGQPVRNGAM